MRVYIVSPSRSISKAFPPDESAGPFPTVFLDVLVALNVRDYWNKRYGIGDCHFEVYEVEARITKKVPRSVPAAR
jgi:hypothetical protein